MIQILWVDLELFSICPDMFFLLVPAEWFAHIIRVFTRSPTCRIITIVFDHPSEDAIPASRPLVSPRPGHCTSGVPDLPHSLIQSNSRVVALPHKQIDKPCVLLFTTSLQCFCQNLRKPQSSILRRNREGSDMAMPREIVLGVL